MPRYRTLNRVAQWFGLRIVANKVMPIMFGRTFLTNPARVVERDLWRERLSSNRREIRRAVNGVIERASIMPELRRITVPTLILVGDEDMATVPRHAEQTGIVGFGTYHYKYASGHEGKSCLTGYSSRKSDITVYLLSGYESDLTNALLAQPDPHKIGKACLYLRRMSDVQLPVLEPLIARSIADTKARYPG